MKITKEERETVSYYTENSQEWTDKHTNDPNKSFFEKQMNQLFQLMPKGKILEIGSGYGKDASLLINHYGIDNYTGVDPSSGLIKLAQNRNPNAQFINSYIDDLDFLEDKFNCLWCSATLIHIPKSKITNSLKIIHSFIKPNGIGFISMLEGSGDMVSSRPGRYYSLYSPDEFSHILEKTGFKVIEKEIIPTNASPWLTYIVEVI